MTTGVSACSDNVTKMARSQILMAISNSHFELTVHTDLTRKLRRALGSFWYAMTARTNEEPCPKYVS